MNYLELHMHRLRYELRNVIANYPPLYLPLARLKSVAPATQVVDGNTEILIEAWPRSGNTFAEQAFRLAQPGDVELAHHFHAPAQVIEAVKRGLPTLVIVRDAIDCVSSFLIRDDAIVPERALRSWIRFHEKIMPYRHGYLTATFQQVTGDFGDVIRRLNARFDTEFKLFAHTPENVARCFDRIEANNRERFGAGLIVETGVARPSSARSARKQVIQQALRSQRLAPLVARAQEIFAHYKLWAHDE